jgi:hypothetical protein
MAMLSIKIIFSAKFSCAFLCRYYRLGVFYAPLSRPSSRQQREDDSWKNYIAAHFGPDRVPAIYTVGDNSTYLNNLFRNRPLEMGYKYHFVFYAHVDEGIIGESEPTETFELGKYRLTIG